MPDLKSIGALFTGVGAPRNPVLFQWRLIRRKGRPFFLVPQETDAARLGLGLYAAQRPGAKVAHALLRSFIGAPFRSFLEPVSLEADPESEIMTFIQEQSGVPFSRLQTPAIMFSYRKVDKRGFVLLTFDDAGENARVIKVGLKPNGHALVEREADVMTQLGRRSPELVQVTGRISTPLFSAFAMPYCFGDNPRSDEGIEVMLRSWLNTDEPMPLERLETWQTLTEACAGKPGFEQINESVSAQPVFSAVQHGDLTPWNVRVNRSGEWNVFDWERGETKGVPGWDWFHFVVQNSILAKRESPEQVADSVEELMSSDRFQEYASQARINDISKPLFLAYLLRQKWVVKPEEGAQATGELYELLCRRWQFQERAAVNGLTESPITNGNGTPVVPNGSAEPIPEAGRKRFANWPWLQPYRQNLGWLLARRKKTTSKLPSFREQLSAHWITIVAAWTMLLGAVAVHYFSNPHMVFIPFYLIPCAMLTLILNRRWGIVAAIAASVLGPMVQRLGDPVYDSFSLWMWNSAMRFFVYLMFILLLDRVRVEVGPNTSGNFRVPRENNAEIN